MFTDVVIMAGGSGTRLWPASNSILPKQFLAIDKTSSFFSTTLERAFAVLGDGGAGHVLVVVGAAHVRHVVSSCAALSRERRDRVIVLSEPEARNTAPALACAAKYLRLISGSGRRALMLTSDHIITPLEAFLSDAAAADEQAARKRLVIFGIPPRGPETGYGYIESAEDLESTAAPGRCFAVASFREKPDRETAESFLATGRFYWNSGMFGFDVDFILDEYRTNARETIAPFDALMEPEADASVLQEGVAVVNAWKGLAKAYATAPKISIDYAIAEKCKSTAVIVGSFDWLDVGSWDEYARLKENAEDHGEREKVAVFSTESANCFVDSDLPVALCGVEDLIVVVRSGDGGGPPAVLVCKRGMSQQVKAVVEEIKDAGRTDLL